jgi:hypothetical protein
MRQSQTKTRPQMFAGKLRASYQIHLIVSKIVTLFISHISHWRDTFVLFVVFVVTNSSSVFGISLRCALRVTVE